VINQRSRPISKPSKENSKTTDSKMSVITKKKILINQFMPSFSLRASGQP